MFRRPPPCLAWIGAAVGFILLLFNARYFLVVRATPPGRAWERIWKGPIDHILEDPLWQSRVSEYESLNQRYAGRPAIVFLGDSITRGFPVEEYFPSVAGDSLLVLNRGINADTILGLEHRFDRNVANLRVEKLFFMIGTNDLLYRSPDETAARVEALLDRYPGKLVFVQSILPVSAARKKVHQGAREYNRKLETMCRRHGYTYIDLYSRFLGERGEMNAAYQADGVHPNGKGYELWKTLIAPYLKM